MTKQKSILLTALVLFFSIFICSYAYADDSRYSISISPLQTDIELDPGMIDEEEFVVKNTGTEPITFTTFTGPYQVQNYTYNGDISIKNQYTEIADWITFYDTEYSINPGESATVKYVVTVPSNAHGGSQYATIGIHTDSGAGEGMIKAGHDFMVILHADVSGVITKKGSIGEQVIPGFLLTPPIGGRVTATNSGNITLISTTTMRVSNAFTGAEIYNNSNNPTIASLLPETIRAYDVEWPDSPRLGIYNVTITTSLLDEIATESRTIIICPIWLICAIIGLIVVFIAIIIAKKRRQSRIKSHGFKFKN